MRGIVNACVRSTMGRMRLSSLTRCARVGPVILYYHSVSDTPLQHISSIYRHKTVAEFASDIDFLLGELPALTFGDLVSASRHGARVSGFFLTFDDGLREVFEIVAPVLHARGLSGAVFVNPHFLDNKGLFYRFKASLLVHWISANGTKAYSRAERLLRDLGGVSRDVYAEILMTRYTEASRLDMLAAAVGLDYNGYLNTARPYMTRAQCKTLQASGWIIGAHSMDHPNYADITEGEQLTQTAESINNVRSMFSPKYTSFAFPFTENGVSPRVYDMLIKTLDVDVVMGTGGWYHNQSLRLLNRVSVEGNRGDAKRVLSPWLAAACCKRVLGGG